MRIDDLLHEIVDAQASDLHLTAGIKPTMRVWGRLVPMEHYDVLTPTGRPRRRWIASVERKGR